MLYDPRKFEVNKDTIENETDTFLSEIDTLVSEIVTLVSDLKLFKLELGVSNKKITNIIDDQVPKTYL